MLQDFAKSAERHKKSLSRNKPASGISSFRLIATLVIAIGFGLGLYSLSQVRPELAPEELLPETAAKAEQATTQNSTSDQPMSKNEPVRDEPFYDFYTLLPESEVIAPKVEEYASTPKDPSAPKPAYLLQAGSFRNWSDADRLKAKLILQGLDVNLSSVQGSDGSIWHRVVVGPFTSRSKLNRAQDILADANTESMLIQQK